LAVMGETMPPMATIVTINLFVFPENTEYWGPDGTLSRASGSELMPLEPVAGSLDIFSHTAFSQIAFDDIGWLESITKREKTR